MNILLLGASGFIGRHLACHLSQAGHRVIGVSRNPDHNNPHVAQWHRADLNTLLTPASWLPLLHDVDVAINAVGILTEAGDNRFDTLHAKMPSALFLACEKARVCRVIQISALGAAVDAPTEYWRSKARADEVLLSRALSGYVLRPSVVFGPDGDSSRVMMQLATLPALMLPEGGQYTMQPVHIDDLCGLILRLLSEEPAVQRVIEVVGPRPMSMRDYIVTLRNGMGLGGQWVVAMPANLADLAARLAQHIPGSVFNPDSLTMLRVGNIAPTGTTQSLLSREPRDPATFAGSAERNPAAWGWLGPLMRLSLAFVWLWTAWVSLFAFDRAQSLAWLAACHIPADVAPAVLIGASMADALIGLALLLRPPRWIWPTQLLVMGGYMVMLTTCLPSFWLHPFGPLSKNLPILASVIVLWMMAPARSAR
ncbi:NAD(P)H-binding protein [Chitinivorax sp. B]|uniref:NAD(P)H-binding protein n=1 Tax=Chitinivorax sp. B TaxID=2502235 RepID=UPI0010F4DC08|nr:NAD(P)H-binding protein [Chitinivorax sp. B]